MLDPGPVHAQGLDPAARIGELAAFRGWRSALLVRQLKGLARSAFPQLYRRYVRRTTRESPPARIPEEELL